MTLNVFTHKVKNPTISTTINSFVSVFGWPERINVYTDGVNSNGFGDGYIKAIRECTDDYIFMLEHDWRFIRKPEHSLCELTELMRTHGIEHLRFNKRVNYPKLYDTELLDMGWCCRTPFVSNNPHIIDRLAYLQYIERGWVQPLSGSMGVEEIISKHIDGRIYGGIGYPQIIEHLNGR